MARPRPLLGLAAGVAAGLVAAAAMAAFEARTSKPAEQDDAEPAALEAADRASAALTGAPVPEPWREAAGTMVHYIAGAVLGGIYGVIAEYRPEASAGFGAAYGVATAALLDEAGVPALDLAPAPEEASAGSRLHGLASHLLYGLVLEGVRALVAGRR